MCVLCPTRLVKRDSVSSRLKRDSRRSFVYERKTKLPVISPLCQNKIFCQRNIKRAQNENENLLSYDQTLGNACLSSLAVDVSLISRNLSFVYARGPSMVFVLGFLHILVNTLSDTWKLILKGMQSGDRSAA